VACLGLWDVSRGASRLRAGYASQAEKRGAVICVSDGEECCDRMGGGRGAVMEGRGGVRLIVATPRNGWGGGPGARRFCLPPAFYLLPTLHYSTPLELCGRVGLQLVA
jgi:hypothetical protein